MSPPDRPGGRERDQQSRRRVVPPALRRRLRHARLGVATDEHLRPANAGKDARQTSSASGCAMLVADEPIQVFGDGEQFATSPTSMTQFGVPARGRAG